MISIVTSIQMLTGQSKDLALFNSPLMTPYQTVIIMLHLFILFVIIFKSKEFFTNYTTKVSR